MTEHHTKQNRVLLSLLSFFAPMVLLGLAFALLGVFPFGEKTVLVVDMNSEYIDYLAQMNESIRSGGSFQRTWNMGMGLNMLGLIAFYTASPFNLLVLLFPVRWITEVVLAITLLKVGLCGFLFSRYARAVFHLPPALLVAFSTAYGLMAYNMVYSSNIMWLDGAAFLPLVLLGVERLLRKGRWGLLLGCLAYVFFCSYYIGYMVGLFAFLYLTAVYFAKENSIREYGKKLLELVGTAGLAGGLCAFLLLPAFLNLRSGQSEMWNLPLRFSLDLPVGRLFTKLLPLGYDSLTDSGTPNLYCSVLAAVLLLLYFCRKTIPLREKLVFGGLTAFLALSLSCDALDLGWHAFEDPTWFPARYSFVVSFWVLYLAMGAIQEREKIRPGALAAACGLAVLLGVEAMINRYRGANSLGIALGLLLVLLYGWLVFWAIKKPKRANIALLLTALVVCAELFANACHTLTEVDDQFHYKTRRAYAGYRDTYAPALAELEELDGGVYRTEITEQRNANGAMLLGYHSISHYSTTTDQALNSFLKGLGYNTGTINELRFAPSTPLTNGLLGIRYVLDEEELPGYGRALKTEQGVTVWRNPAAFPLAYFGDASALEIQPSGRDPFRMQNELTAALWEEASAGEPFIPLEIGQELLHDAEKIEHGTYVEYARLVREGASSVEWIVRNPTGEEAYAFFPVYNSRFSRAMVYIDGEPLQRDLGYRENTVLPLGNAPEVSVRLEFSTNQMRMYGVYFYALDLEQAVSLAEQAQALSAEFTAFRDTRVGAVLAAPREGVLLTSFPYDDGWTVWVDGVKTETQRFAGVFLAVPVEGGQHTIVMRYRSPGFLPGLCISAATLLGLGLWYFLWKKKGRSLAQWKKK